MDADIYGMIPNAKIEALEKAPPENMFNKARRPSLVCSCNFDSISVDTWKNHIRTESVDCNKQYSNEDPLSQILNIPYVL